MPELIFEDFLAGIDHLLSTHEVKAKTSKHFRSFCRSKKGGKISKKLSNSTADFVFLPISSLD